MHFVLHGENNNALDGVSGAIILNLMGLVLLLPLKSTCLALQIVFKAMGGGSHMSAFSCTESDEITVFSVNETNYSPSSPPPFPLHFLFHNSNKNTQSDIHFPLHPYFHQKYQAQNLP